MEKMGLAVSIFLDSPALVYKCQLLPKMQCLYKNLRVKISYMITKIFDYRKFYVC